MPIKRRKKTFVLIIPSFEDIFHSYYAGEIIKGASLAASRLNVDILIHIVNRFDHRGWIDSSLLDVQYVDGIIFGDIDNDVAVVKRVINRRMPTIVLNNYLNEPINCVAIDNYKAGVEAVRHFVKLGHKRIATIAGEQNTQAGVLRLDGYHAALTEIGIKAPKSYVTYGDFLRTPARAAAKKLLNLKTRPTAIFAASDVMAMELMDVAKAQNIKVPQDLSIIGFDDNPLNANCSLPLTTVSQPLIEMARLGTEDLYQICQGKARLPVKVMLPAKLIVRQTTAACPVHARDLPDSGKESEDV